jgi:peptidoglycan hydrolase-like protein with peptidoglycan-binding domain
MKKLVLKKPLKTGSSGPEVEMLQSILVDVKARPKLKTDGKFGPKTKAAVVHFQKLRCPMANGIVDKRTAEMLNACLKLPKGDWPEMDAKDWTRRRKSKVKGLKASVNIMKLETAQWHDKYDDGTREVGKYLRVMDLCYKNARREFQEWYAMASTTGKAQQEFDKLMIKGKVVPAKAVLKIIHTNDPKLVANEKEIKRLYFKFHKLMKIVFNLSAKGKKKAA